MSCCCSIYDGKQELGADKAFMPQQANKVREESHGSKVTTLVEPHHECNSPWKVLSLINLQCERLLHRRDVEESEPSSTSSTAKLGHPTAKSSTAAAEHGQWRTKTPRKQPHPSRSVDIQDPDFQGVTFRMGTELDDSREQCRLLITSNYSRELCKNVRKPRLRTRTSQKSLKTSSSDEESDSTTIVSKGKVCASCCTRKTPMWRDAEDGTPLCNACGIRYKKYRVRCVNCWHIPRKEGNSNSCCLKCGNLVRLTSAQRKHTT
ncbi:uncharacterized protein AKAME5_001774000 [Lates japonicus]|uniref:GATA-type domain-containing protein n=1 Tax=Lates japonicus TaxID=270547 RepID=A0AAD3N5G9_LATJO|nr:uncharacterized protein AKAME5_001774000 [Lates japonicus]